jgi:hypothetical protein
MNIEQQKQNSIAALRRYNSARADRYRAAIKKIENGKVSDFDLFVEKFHLTEQKHEEQNRHAAFEAQLTHEDEETETEKHEDSE